MPLAARTRALASQVVYQIFPERFAIGSGTQARPAREGFFGGDLDGLTEHLDHLSALGATALYLTPIFEAPSVHKYDTTDFLSVDRTFGGGEALDRLLAALHGRGMKLILDAVLNHVSDRHPWFLAARAGDPRYRAFFTFDGEGRHRAWQGRAHLPELNLANPEVLELLYRGPDSLVQHWLARGVDGWRFDTANDVGLRVAEDLAAVVHARFPEAWLVGELFGFGGAWLKEGRTYDGVMNYYFQTALLAWLNGEMGAVQMNRAVADARDGYGLEGLLASWTLLSSHDTPRLRHSVPDLARRRLATLAQMTLPGVPMLYYGEEIGMEGGADPDNRRPMVWDETLWDAGHLAWVKALVALRQGCAALRHGDVAVLGDRLPGNALVFLRRTDHPFEAALVVLNGSDQPLRTRLLLPHSHLYDALPLRDLLGRAPDLKVEAASVVLDLPPLTGAVYAPFEPFPDYRFFKDRNQR